MEHFSFIASMAALCLTLMNIWGKMSRPVENNKEQIQSLTDRIGKLEDKIQRDWNSFNKQENVNAVLLKSQWAIMSHLLDGNHTQQLESCKDEVEKMFINKGSSLS